MHSAATDIATRQPSRCMAHPSGAVAHSAPIMPVALDWLTTRV